MNIVQAERYHDISCGHRVAGHESKCAFLHGHNYRIHFTCQAVQLDGLGRVIDFSVMKSKLCMWLEDHWDHKFLAWAHDPLLMELLGHPTAHDPVATLRKSIVWTSFNPTAENMGLYLLYHVGPEVLKDTGVTLVRVRVDETRKCSATIERND
jgi:6-pyruvoyltetrahydropterin/6-carboxytetrahydropterin synthase